jgi:hypothetical protein
VVICLPLSKNQLFDKQKFVFIARGSV